MVYLQERFGGAKDGDQSVDEMQSRRRVGWAKRRLVTTSEPAAYLCIGVLSNVHYLPGFPGPLPFELETGYISADEKNDVQLFYYFIKSERDPTKDPLILWLTGGPRCSAISGMMYEIGPLYFNKVEYDGTLPTLKLNPYSWTKVANIIFLDAPVGTGFSYSNSIQGSLAGDIISGIQTRTFLKKWFFDHPEFLLNPFYIGGDSYSGITIPLLALDVSDGNKGGIEPAINLKGYILGNPKTDRRVDRNGQIPYAHGMGLISNELFESLKKNCEGEYYNVDPSNKECTKDLEAFSECVSKLNGPQILEPKCIFASPKPSANIGVRRSLNENSSKFLRSPPPDPGFECRGKVEEWSRCDFGLPYTREIASVVEYHANLSSRGYRSLIYSGDHDFVVPFRGTEAWIKSLNYSIVDDWRPWNVGIQIAGSNVHYLPGFPGPLPFELETGYISADEKNDVQLFYYFIKSERDPTKDPLILWLTGGPGCSAISGMMYEIGPLYFNKVEYDGTLPTLKLNPYSWTKVANIIFLDAPVGTGFSYSNSIQGSLTGDIISGIQTRTFLKKWFFDHPEFLLNPFYIGGDSYSGITIPPLALDVSDGNKGGIEPAINLKGYILGNPGTNRRVDHNGQIPYAHGMGLISNELFESLKKNCEGEYYNVDPSNKECTKDLEAFSECVSKLNGAQILEPICIFASPKPSANIGVRRSLNENSSKFLRSPPPDPGFECRGKVEEWSRCDYGLPYTSEIASVVEYHANLSSRGYRSLIYSGDHDFVVPFRGTEAWIKSLNYSIVDDWRPWNVGIQIAGKDGLRLRLLLTCLQNGITEPWQRIPSVVAIFSVEASFVLLDPSNDHYAAIINVVISSRTITEWLQTYSLEQLSEFSSHALKLFADNSKMIRHDVPLVISLLKVLVSTLRISQKRKLYQPHFTLSHEGLFQLCQAVDTDVRSSLAAELGLRAMLMSTPPAVLNYEISTFIPDGKVLLLKSVTWGICTASRPYATDQVFQIPTGSYYTSVSEEDHSQDSLISKLLRWVTASVILEKVLESFKTLFSPEIKNARTLQALLENVERRHMQSSVNDYAESRSNNEVLASIILYLQQLLVVESRVLSSVVSALSLLLSYYKPWEDLTSTQTELEKIEERHACQTLIVIFSSALKGKSSELGLLPILTHQDLVKSGVFEWEKNFLIDGLSDACILEVSDEAIEAKIEEIISQFEVLSSENQLLRESIVEKDKLILELEAALDQVGCGAGKCNIEIVGQPLYHHKGLGCMGMSAFYGPSKPESDMISLARHAVNRGITFLDTSDVYGPHTNETLLGKALSDGYRDKVELATKFGLSHDESNNWYVHGDPAYVRAACEGSLKRLQVDCIDLYYQHRVDTSLPIEVTIKYVGLSEASASTIRRANAVHPVTAVQLEWSLWSRDAEEEIIPTCRELGIGIVAYSPLGRGFLSSGPKILENVSDEDLRKQFPRFQAENMENNKRVFEKVNEMARRKGCTPAQLALAWVHHQGSDVCPIPGTTKIENLEQNIGALSIKLSPKEMSELESFASEDVVKGHRSIAVSTLTWKHQETPLFSTWKPNN
ncbi:hypothetical protein Syun_004563 [Stephania yunnanensis]|uniref:NADP-dependent oxidoreductase domain-containing protein n=1 Tax=Stephania yunnanensis TaxID=152371 RepID=A0AAP0Q529_9MAGN